MKKSRYKKFEQLGLPRVFERRELAFGGTLLKGNNPKVRRPIDSKLPIHLVLKSSQAVGEKSLRKGRRLRDVETTVRRTAKKYGVRIYEYGNSGNHLHILLKVHKRFLWKPFICELTGRIAALVVGFAKGKGQKFWDFRPFTRVVAGWGRSYRLVKDYVALNGLEALGIVSRTQRNWRSYLAVDTA